MIAAHDNNLFRRETFEAIAQTLARHVPLDCVAVVIPEPACPSLARSSNEPADRSAWKAPPSR